MVMMSKIDHKVRESQTFQILCPQRAMVPVLAHSPGQWEMESDQSRCDSSPPEPETGMTFADVVEKCGEDPISRDITALRHQSGRLITVRLISVILGKEHLGPFRVEPGADLGDLRFSEWSGPRKLEESTHEVRQRTGHSLLVVQVLAVDAENGFGPRFKSGRCYFLAAPVAYPICSCLDVGQCGIDLVKLVLEGVHET